MFLYPHLIWRPSPEDYNCSGKTAEEWEAMGTKSPILGAYFITSGILFLIFYILIIISMSDRKILDSPCFKIMYFNCYIDCCSIFIDGVLTGILFHIGAVFCTHPFLTYVPGNLAIYLWAVSCWNCLAIGINRFCIVFEKFEGLFQGKRTYLWIACPTLFLWVLTIMTRQPIFNSTMGAWFFFPFIEDMLIESEKYKNYVHTSVNFGTAIGITIIYSAIGIRIFYVSRVRGGRKLSASQLKLLFQCFLISFSTSIAAYLYSYMQFFHVRPELIIVASVAWELCSATPIFVYFFLNSTIRKKVLRVLRRIKLLPSAKVSVAPSSVVSM